MEVCYWNYCFAVILWMLLWNIEREWNFFSVVSVTCCLPPRPLLGGGIYEYLINTPMNFSFCTPNIAQQQNLSKFREDQG